MRKRSRPHSGDFSELLTSAQAGSVEAAEALVDRHHTWIKREALAVASKKGVPACDREDVVQETYRRLLEPRYRRYCAARGTPQQYIYGEICNAVEYSKRRRRARFRATQPAGTTADIVASMWNDGDGAAGFRNIETKATLASLLSQATPTVRRALEVIVGDAATQREAARVVGISEFKLSRALKQFYAGARAAALRWDERAA